jgi:hypothetical protein
MQVPEGLKRVVGENESQNGSNSGQLAITTPKRHTVDLGVYQAEYVFNRKNVNIHFYRKHGGLFPASFNSRLMAAFSSWPGEHNGIDVKWFDEVQSWCVTVYGGAELPPGRDAIVATIKSVVD